MEDELGFRFELFSLKRAQRTASEIRDKLIELRVSSRRLQALKLRMEILSRFGKVDPKSRHLMAEIRALELRIKELREQVEAKGVVIRSIYEGLVDFPTIYKGHPAYFSWRPDEPKIEYWYPADKPRKGKGEPQRFPIDLDELEGP